MDLEGKGDGEELGGAGGGETIMGIECMRKESVFSKRKEFEKS